MRAAGLRLLAKEGYESNSVTAFHPPEGMSTKEMLALLRSEYSIEAQGGQGSMADTLVRVGHMGWAHEPELRAVTKAIGEIATRFQAERDAALPGAEVGQSTTFA